jgi:LysR family transcriptional activator of nhaA
MPGECRGVRHAQVFESDVALFAAPSLARRLRQGFPASLDGAPVLLSHEGSALRDEVERWFARARVRPRVVAELTDRDVIEALGAEGVGVFAAATALRSDLVSGRGVEELGVLSQVRERVFAVGAARAFEHPAVAELLRWHPGVSAATDNDVTLARFVPLTPTGT